MKNFKKVSTLVLIAIIASLPLVSCGAPKATPEESTKILLDVLFKDDKTNIDKIGLSEDYYKETRETLEKGIDSGLAIGGADKNVLTDDLKATLKKDVIQGLKKLDYQVTKVSEDKDTAKVEIKIKGFDMTKITDAAKTKLQEEVTANPNMDQNQIYKEAFKLVGDQMANGTIADKPKSINLTLNKVKNVWIPKSSDLVDLTTGIYVYN